VEPSFLILPARPRHGSATRAIAQTAKAGAVPDSLLGPEAAGKTETATQGTHGTQHVVSDKSGVIRTEEQFIRPLIELRRDAAAEGDASAKTNNGPVAVEPMTTRHDIRDVNPSDIHHDL
jgi:hypothetical protein